MSKNPLIPTEFSVYLRRGPLAEFGLRPQNDAETATTTRWTPMKTFSSPTHQRATLRALRVARDASADARHGLYLGHDAHTWHHADAQQSVLVLGPPRSGKTSALLIPNVLSAHGAVVTTSTKPDVLDATREAALDVRNVPSVRPDRFGRRPARRPPPALVATDRMHVVAHRTFHRPVARAGGQWRSRICPGRGLPLDRAGRGAPGAAAACRSPGGRRHAHRPDLGRSTPGPAGPAGALGSRGGRPGHRPRPPGRHHHHRRTGTERHLVDGVGGARGLPIHRGAGRHLRSRLRPGGLRAGWGHRLHRRPGPSPGTGGPPGGGAGR